MHKVLDKVVAGMKRYSLSIGVLGLALIIGGTHFATAQQSGGSNGNSLGNHHSEFTLLTAPGEVAYIPIPKQNVPIRVDVSFSGGYYQLATFLVTDPEEGNGLMTMPTIDITTAPALCGPKPFSTSFNGVSYAIDGFPCFDQNTGDHLALIIGLTEVSSENPHRIFFTVPMSAGTVTARVQMWY